MAIGCSFSIIYECRCLEALEITSSNSHYSALVSIPSPTIVPPNPFADLPIALCKGKPSNLNPRSIHNSQSYHQMHPPTMALS